MKKERNSMGADTAKKVLIIDDDPPEHFCAECIF